MKKLIIFTALLLSIGLSAGAKKNSWHFSEFLTVSPTSRNAITLDRMHSNKVYTHPSNENVTFSFYNQSKDSDSINPLYIQKLFHAYENDPAIFGWGDTELDFLLVVTSSIFNTDRRHKEKIEKDLKRQSDDKKFKILDSKEYRTNKNIKVLSTTYSSIVNGLPYIQSHHFINDRNGAYDIIAYPMGTNTYKNINPRVREIVKTAIAKKQVISSRR